VKKVEVNGDAYLRGEIMERDAVVTIIGD